MCMNSKARTASAVTFGSTPQGEFQRAATGREREAAHPSLNAPKAQKKATLMPLSR